MTDLAGQVMERHEYTPYGQPVVNQENSWCNRDGDEDIDFSDKGTPGTTCSGPLTTGSCKIMDTDNDGDYDNVDGNNFDNLPQGLARHPARLATGVDQPFGHQGLLFDPEISSYQNRARQYLPTLRRFAQRDPLGYTDGMNACSYARTNPLKNVDPSGSRIACNDGQVPSVIPHLCPCCNFTCVDGDVQMDGCPCPRIGSGPYRWTRRRLSGVIRERGRTLIVHEPSLTRHDGTSFTDDPYEYGYTQPPAEDEEACQDSGGDCATDGNWHVYIRDMDDENEATTSAHEIFGHFQPPPHGDWGHGHEGDAWDDENSWRMEAGLPEVDPDQLPPAPPPSP